MSDWLLKWTNSFLAVLDNLMLLSSDKTTMVSHGSSVMAMVKTVAGKSRSLVGNESPEGVGSSEMIADEVII